MTEKQRKEPFGRPTKYSPELCEKVDEYLKKTIDKHDEAGYSVDLPTAEGLALFLEVDRSTLYEWVDKYPDFSYSFDKLLIEQKNRVLNKSLEGRYNPTIAKLILSANHGMSEKTQTDITTNGESVNFYLPKKDGMETS